MPHLSSNLQCARESASCSQSWACLGSLLPQNIMFSTFFFHGPLFPYYPPFLSRLDIRSDVQDHVDHAMGPQTLWGRFWLQFRRSSEGCWRSSLQASTCLLAPFRGSGYPSQISAQTRDSQNFRKFAACNKNFRITSTKLTVDLASTASLHCSFSLLITARKQEERRHRHT